MKFLLVFGLLQAVLALSTLDETHTVPGDVQNQGIEVRHSSTFIASCRFELIHSVF